MRSSFARRPSSTASRIRASRSSLPATSTSPFATRRRSLHVRVREKLALAIGATADKLALTGSTTDGCNIVLSGFGLRHDDEVVTTNSEHPGLLLPLHASGARVRIAEVTTRPSSEALEAIRAEVTPRTRLIALSHVIWTTGQVMPVHELKRETGLPIVVDGAQSVGAIPVDIRELDFYTVSCQKWLCGPEPTGALYVREPEAPLVSFVAPGDAADDAARLYDRGVIVRDLPGTGWLRASCGWWNDESDLERLLDAL